MATICTQTEPDVTLQNLVVPRASHGTVVMSNKDALLSWDSNTVVRNYLLNCSEFLNDVNDTPPARPSTTVVNNDNFYQWSVLICILVIDNHKFDDN